MRLLLILSPENYKKAPLTFKNEANTFCFFFKNHKKKLPCLFFQCSVFWDRLRPFFYLSVLLSIETPLLLFMFWINQPSCIHVLFLLIYMISRMTDMWVYNHVIDVSFPIEGQFRWFYPIWVQFMLNVFPSLEID